MARDLVHRGPGLQLSMQGADDIGINQEVPRVKEKDVTFINRKRQLWWQ